jgi:hypothetical protein
MIQIMKEAPFGGILRGMKRGIGALLLGLLVATGQAGLALSELNCLSNPKPCCCAPASAKSSAPCPMFKKSAPQVQAIMPSAISIQTQPVLAWTISLPANETLKPLYQFSLERSLSPPGASSHQLPPLRAPPVLA